MFQKDSSLEVLGYQQITALSSAQSLTVPAGARVALITPYTKGIRWRDDGTSPTASVGMPLDAGLTLFYTGNLSAFKAIELSATAELNIAYYR